MTLRKHFAKHLHPVLKSNGFQYLRPFWMNSSSEPWRTAISFSSSLLTDDRWFLQMDIGLFSYEIDALTDAMACEFETTRGDLPLGVITCHFQTSIFSLSEDTEWELLKRPGPLFETEEDAVAEIRKMSEKLDRVLPKLVARYANYEALIECKRQSIGTEAQSKKAGLFAAAACILLERYDEAEAFLGESIRPASNAYDKKIGDALSQLILKRKPKPA